MIGLALIALSSVVFGAANANALLRENKCRRAILKMIGDIRVGISVGHPLCEIYPKLDGTQLCRKEPLRSLGENTDRPIYVLFTKGRGISSLSSEEKEALMAFSASLGMRADTDAELAAIDKVASLIAAKRNEHEKENTRKAALSLKLGLLGAAAAVVVFI